MNFPPLIGYAVTDRIKRRTTLFIFAPIAIVVGLIHPNLTGFWAIAICGFMLVSCVYTMTAVTLYAYIPELFPTALRLRGNSVSSVAVLRRMSSRKLESAGVPAVS